MKYRPLGKTGIEVSEIGYGAWGIGGSQWGGADDDESLQALHKAIDLGLTFIDTALAYGRGRSERLVGQVVRERRPEPIHVATKVPPKNLTWPAPEGIPVEEAFPGAPGPFHDSRRTRVSLVSTETLGSWDRRRFRSNVLLE